MRLDEMLTTQQDPRRVCVSVAAAPGDSRLALFRRTMEDLVCAQTLQFHQEITQGIRRREALSDYSAWASVLSGPINVPGADRSIQPLWMVDSEYDYEVDVGRDNEPWRDLGLHYFPKGTAVARDLIDKLQATFRRILNSGGSVPGDHRLMSLEVSAFMQVTGPSGERPTVRVSLMERHYHGSTCTVRARPFYLEYIFEPDRDSEQSRSLKRYLEAAAFEDIRRARAYFAPK